MSIYNNLIFIHGWGFNNSIWDYNRNYIDIINQSKNYNIIKLNLNGHGDNKYIKFNTLDDYCEYLINYFKNNINNFCGSNNYILGWSLGGTIALKLKYNYPELFNNIILCCSNPCFINNNNWHYGISQNNWDKFCSNLIDNQEKTIKDFLLLQVLNTINYKLIYKKLLNIYNNKNINIASLNWGLEILKNNYLNILYEINNKEIKFILGARDTLVNKGIVEYFNNHHPDIECNILAKSGHMPFVTESEEFYQLIYKYINI